MTSLRGFAVVDDPCAMVPAKLASSRAADSKGFCCIVDRGIEGKEWWQKECNDLTASAVCDRRTRGDRKSERLPSMGKSKVDVTGRCSR